MYPVTELYKSAIEKDNRVFTCDIKIEHSQGILELTDVNLSQGSLTYNEASQSGTEFTVGGTVASNVSFTIFNKPEYADIQFMGATAFVTIGLFVLEGTDAHFLQPSQPSKMQGSDDVWEYVTLGKFHIDDVSILSNTIQLKAMDNMINLDKPYSLSKLTYPATLQQIYNNLCDVADIPTGTLDFPNKDYVVNVRPTDDITLRDVLGYVAELSGTFAKCNRNGSLELRWYEPTDLEIKPSSRYDFSPSDDVVQITGVSFDVTERVQGGDDIVTAYISGSEGYVIDLTENPLLQGEYETVLPNIYNNIKDVEFTPYSSSCKGNPAIQAGDMVRQIDKKGKIYDTLVTKLVYKYRGRGTLEGKGQPQIAKGYKGSTNKKLAEIKRKVDVEVGNKLTALEEQQLQASELIANMLGGYAINTDDAFYIADNPDLTQAVKVWKWGLGGFGYSSTGVNGTYTAAITAEGSIVAELITAGIVSADMIYTGTMESQNGNSSINLDDGVLKLGNNNNDPLLYFNGNDSLTFGNGVSLAWGQIDNKPYIPSVPSYITSTKITQTTIESPNIFGGLISGDTIISNDAVGLSGLGSYGDSIRIWAGSPDKNSAPFRVTQDGSVYMNKANIETESINNQYVKMYGSRIDGGRQDYGLSYVIGTAEYTGASRSGVVQLFGYSSGTSTSISRQLDVGNNLIQVKGSNLVLGGSVESRPTVITRTAYLSDLTRSVPSDVALYVKGGLQVTGPITGITAGDLPEHPHYTTGVNSNGTYVKYDDGTMICYASAKPITIGNMEELPSGIWRTDNSSHIEVTFPDTFISRPTVQINIYIGETLNVPPRFIYTTHFNGRFLSTVDYSNRSTEYDLFAIGRWK